VFKKEFSEYSDIRFQAGSKTVKNVW